MIYYRGLSPLKLKSRESSVCRRWKLNCWISDRSQLIHFSAAGISETDNSSNFVKSLPWRRLWCVYRIKIGIALYINYDVRSPEATNAKKEV